MSLIIGNAPLPRVEDEAARGVLYPSPTDGQQVFNDRIGLIETYNSVYGLWLSDNVEPMVRVNNIVAVENHRIVYMDGSFGVGSAAIPSVIYPTSNSNDDRSIGVVVEVGNSANAVTDYIGVATKGKYFVQYAPLSIISAGQFLSAKVQGSDSDQGYATANTSPFGGTIGAAYQNSGADPTMSDKVLVKIEITR